MQKSKEKINSASLIISSILLTLISFFFVFSAGTFFEIGIFPLEDGFTILKLFDTFVFDQFIDTLLISIFTIVWFATALFGKAKTLSIIIYGAITLAAFATNMSALLDFTVLISLPVIISILIYNKFSTTKILKGSSNLTLIIFALFGIGLGLISLFISASIFQSFGITVPDYAFDIFVLISVLSPVLILFLVGGSIVRLLMIKSFNKLKFNLKSEFTSSKLNSKTKILFLTFLMALSIFVVLIPHHPTINTENLLVSADSADYARWINDLKSYEGIELIHQVFVVHKSSDRPISMLFFYSLVEIFPDSPSQVIDHLPIIFGPALVLVAFFLTRELTSNDITSLFASFITAVSFHTLIGVYSGFYANWVALIIGYLSFVFLIKFLKIPTKRNYIFFSILLFLLLLSHVYTWTILVIFMIVFLAVAYKLKFFKIKNAVLILLIILASIAVDVGKETLTESVGGIQQDIAIANTRAGTENIFVIWENLEESIQVFSGGQFSNILILLLCVCWLVRSDFNSMRDVFIGIFFSIALVPLLFGNDLIQSRVLYNIPFQIPAAIGLMYFFNRPYGKLIVLAICIAIFAMAIKSVSNLI